MEYNAYGASMSGQLGAWFQWTSACVTITAGPPVTIWLHTTSSAGGFSTVCPTATTVACTGDDAHGFNLDAVLSGPSWCAIYIDVPCGKIAPTAIAACCGFDLYHEYILYHFVFLLRG